MVSASLQLFYKVQKLLSRDTLFGNCPGEIGGNRFLKLKKKQVI